MTLKRVGNHPAPFFYSLPDTPCPALHRHRTHAALREWATMITQRFSYLTRPEQSAIIPSCGLSSRFPVDSSAIRISGLRDSVLAMPVRNPLSAQQLILVEWTIIYRKHAAQTQSIINIHTETIDFSGRLKTFLAQNYKSRFPNHENLDLEAILYANMTMTLAEYYISNANSSITNKSIISSYIYTFLYAISIHDEQLIQKEYNRFLQMKYPKWFLPKKYPTRKPHFS